MVVIEYGREETLRRNPIVKSFLLKGFTLALTSLFLCPKSMKNDRGMNDEKVFFNFYFFNLNDEYTLASSLCW
jgi:hypothetical protein